MKDNNIVAFFRSPDGNNKEGFHKYYANRPILIRDPSTGRCITATVYDTCADSDCTSCCTTNAKNGDGRLIDLEINTARRLFGPNGVRNAVVQYRFLDNKGEPSDAEWRRA